MYIFESSIIIITKLKEARQIYFYMCSTLLYIVNKISNCIYNFSMNIHNAIQMTPNLIATRESKCQEVYFYKIGVCERYIITLEFYVAHKKKLKREIIIIWKNFFFNECYMGQLVNTKRPGFSNSNFFF